MLLAIAVVCLFVVSIVVQVVAQDFGGGMKGALVQDPYQWWTELERS